MSSSKTNIIYYDNELEDEFSTAQIEAKEITKDYDYDGGLRRRIARRVLYHFVAKNLARLYLKIRYGHKIVGKKKLKNAGGCFIYGNHTNAMADPYVPTMVVPHGDVYVIVHPANVSIPVLGKINPALGALPIPDDIEGMKHFTKRVDELFSLGKQIAIYPEAHIWPYCTFIRNFKDTSFRYPAKNNANVFCFTNTYQKRKFFKGPKMVTYVDGPFRADESLSVKDKKKYLHSCVINAMKERSKNNTVHLVEYKRREETLPDADV